MNEDINKMRKELIQLIRDREGMVGTDRKRTNRMIAELQHKIDCAKELARGMSKHD